MVLGRGALGRCLGLDGGAPMSGISAHKIEAPEKSPALLPLRTQGESASWEPGESLHENTTTLTPFEAKASSRPRGKALPPHASAGIHPWKKIMLFLPGETLPRAMEESSLIRFTNRINTQGTHPEPILEGKKIRQ